MLKHLIRKRLTDIDYHIISKRVILFGCCADMYEQLALAINWIIND
jgi:hypothetical protein